MISRGLRCRGILLSSCVGRERLTTGRSIGMCHSQSRGGIRYQSPKNRLSYRPISHAGAGKMPSSHNRFPPASFSTLTKSDYVHPLSQIVLEHLQSNHSQWVQQMGLDTALTLNKDGTFVLRFPDSDSSSDASEAVAGDFPEDEAGTNGSIWTMYEPEEKKHYLCVRKGGLVGRYMLQDNKKPAWHSDKRSTPERVQDAVDEMIEKINEVGNVA